MVWRGSSIGIFALKGKAFTPVLLDFRGRSAGVDAKRSEGLPRTQTDLDTYEHAAILKRGAVAVAPHPRSYQSLNSGRRDLPAVELFATGLLRAACGPAAGITPFVSSLLYLTDQMRAFRRALVSIEIKF